jgi:dUTP pyrophosphatase
MNTQTTEIQIQYAGTHTDLPAYATEGAAAVDLIADIVEDCILQPGEIRIISSGLKVAIPMGYVGWVVPRSGQALRGLSVANSPGIIDSDYRGIVGILAQNITSECLTIKPKERLAQFVFTHFVKAGFKEVTELDSTVRGERGFGSSGRV